MGKQYNKVMKRRRRVAYLARRKEAINELVSSKPKAPQSQNQPKQNQQRNLLLRRKK